LVRSRPRRSTTSGNRLLPFRVFVERQVDRVEAFQPLVLSLDPSVRRRTVRHAQRREAVRVHCDRVELALGDADRTHARRDRLPAEQDLLAIEIRRELLRLRRAVRVFAILRRDKLAVEQIRQHDPVAAGCEFVGGDRLGRQFAIVGQPAHVRR
jgi:hypothetical protein